RSWHRVNSQLYTRCQLLGRGRVSVNNGVRGCDQLSCGSQARLAEKRSADPDMDVAMSVEPPLKRPHRPLKDHREVSRANCHRVEYRALGILLAKLPFARSLAN